MPQVLLLASLLWAATASVAPLPDSAPLLTDEEIDAINAAGFWIADKSLIEGKTLGDLRRHRRNPPRTDIPANEYSRNELENVTISSTFDSRTQWPGCVHAIEDQGDCLGSWAMAAADALSDRFCTQLKQQLTLSPQLIIDCQTSASGCDGGTAEDAWTLLAKSGATTATCVPFAGDTATCPTSCSNGSTFTKYTAGNYQSYSGIASIQTAISQSGPVEACFQMYSDFSAYASGIYVQSYGSIIGEECVKLIGWGVQSGINYWIGAAYFGTEWGQAGYFYMKMGQLDIESDAVAANPSS